MLTAVAYSNDNDTGLSQEDLRIATALIHCRFRGLFSGLTHERSRDDQIVLVVWGTKQTDEPFLTVNQANGRYVVTDETTGQVFQSDAIEDVLEQARAQYPQITAF